MRMPCVWLCTLLLSCWTAGCLSGCAGCTQAATTEERASSTEETLTVREVTADGPQESEDGTEAPYASEVTLTNDTGYDIVEIAMRQTGTQAWPDDMVFDGLYVADGSDISLALPPTASTSVHHDLRLTTSDDGTIILEDLDLGATDITLRFHEGIGYSTYTERDGSSVDTYDDAVESNVSEDALTYDMQSQLD